MKVAFFLMDSQQTRHVNDCFLRNPCCWAFDWYSVCECSVCGRI